MNTLFLDLVAAVGPFMATALNAQPPERKRVVDDALGAGGWLEVRVGIMNQAVDARVVLVNLDGQVLELVRIDYSPQ